MISINNTNFYVSANHTQKKISNKNNQHTSTSKNTNHNASDNINQYSKKSLAQYQKYDKANQNPRIILNKDIPYSARTAVNQYAENDSIESMEKRNNLLGFTAYA